MPMQQDTGSTDTLRLSLRVQALRFHLRVLQRNSVFDGILPLSKVTCQSRGDCARLLQEQPGPTWVHSPSTYGLASGTGSTGFPPAAASRRSSWRRRNPRRLSL
eukprot:2154908-Amphidinium_carterae.1